MIHHHRQMIYESGQMPQQKAQMNEESARMIHLHALLREWDAFADLPERPDDLTGRAAFVIRGVE